MCLIMIGWIVWASLGLALFKGEVRAQGCHCPPGFSVGVGGNVCTRKSSTAPTGVVSSRPVEVGEGNIDHLAYPFHLIKTSSNANWPFVAQNGNFPVQDATGLTLSNLSVPRTQPWLDLVKPANRVMIKGGTQGAWYSKAFCLSIPESRNYVFFVGGDNNWKVLIDGEDFAQCTSNYCFRHGLFLEQQIGSGQHFFEIRYRNFSGPGALWVEIFQNSGAEIQTRPYSDLNRIFSTRSLVGSSWDYMSDSGGACPDGYTFDSCSTRTCVKYENIACDANLTVRDSICGAENQVTFYNTTGEDVDAVWSLYRLNASGGRIQPPIASTATFYPRNAEWAGSLLALFGNPGLQDQILSNSGSVRFELSASVQARSGGGRWDYQSVFTIKPIPARIAILNNPPHPDPAPILPDSSGDFAVFKDHPVQFQAAPLAQGVILPSGFRWTLPQGSPTDPIGNPVTSTWFDVTPLGGVPIEAIALTPNGCEIRAKTRLIVDDPRGPLVPTAFSPNRDGLNDVFRPLGKNIDWQVFSIYNRMGQRLYHHEGGGQPKGWNGDLPTKDVQNFVVVGKWRYQGDPSGRWREYKGNLILVH